MPDTSTVENGIICPSRERYTSLSVPTCWMKRLSGNHDKRFYQYSSEYRKDIAPGEDIFLIRNGQKLRYDEVFTSRQ